MKKRLSFPIAGLIVLTVLSADLGLQASPLEEGMALFEHREDLLNAYEAVRIWEKALPNASRDEQYALYWHISSAYHFIGSHEDSCNKNKVIQLFERGYRAGQKGIELNPKGVDSMFWAASNLGEKGQAQGIFRSLSLVGPLKKTMERIIELDPDYYCAYMTLGILYIKAPPWPVSIGNRKKGIETLEYAIELNPKCLRCYLELSCAYLKEKDIEKARKAAQDLLDAGIEPGYEVETPEYRIQAKHLLRATGARVPCQ